MFVNGKQIRDDCYLTEQNEQVSVCVLPVFDEVACLAYTVIITLERDRVACVTGGAQVVPWPNGVCDVYLHPPKLPFRHTPVTLAQCGERHLATLYDDGEMHLMCEGPSFVVHDVPKLTSYSLTSSERDGFLVMLTGKTQEKSYVLVISAADGGHVIHEHLAERIEVTSSGVTVHTRLMDMKRRTACACYNAEGRVVSKSFERTERSFPDALIPYAFLEALLAGDTEDALAMLAPDLRHGESLAEFFGTFDLICQPPYDCTPYSVATVTRRDGLCEPRVFCFSVDHGIINSVQEK